MKIDFDQAQRFLSLLDETAEQFTFQTFDDTGKGRKSLTKVINSDFDTFKDALSRLNKNGAGVFVTVNETDFKGRKIENIVRPRAIWIEDDHGTNLNPLGLEPHIIVQSSIPSKTHKYYLIHDSEPVDFDEWWRVEQRLVLEYDSDPKAADLARVMRLPGFYHNKSEPLLAHIIHESGAQPYSWDYIKKCVPPIEEKEYQPPAEPGNGENLPELRSALAFIDPDCDYGDWIKIGMAVHHATGGGSEGYLLWDEWSQGALSENHVGAKYPKNGGQCTAYKWTTFKASGNETGQVTELSIFKLARENGWKGLDQTDKNLSVFKQALDHLSANDDVSQLYNSTTIESLAWLKANNDPEFRNCYRKLKKFGEAGNMEKEVKCFLFKKMRKNPTHPAHSALSGPAEDLTQHLPSIDPALLSNFSGKLVDFEQKRPVLIPENYAADEVAKALKGVVGFCGNGLIWHIFTGTHWKPLPGGNESATRFFIQMIGAGCDPIGYKKSYLNNILAFIQDGAYLPLPNTQKLVIPFGNGLLDPISKTLAPATPDKATTWILPYEYTPEADCPNFKKWLNQITSGDDDLKEFLRAWLSALVQGVNVQKFLHLVGAGGSGKSTFTRLACKLIGDKNVAETDLQRMETERRFETASYYGKRLIVVADSDAYGGGVDMLKKITGGDKLPLERKFKDKADGFYYDGLLIMTSNKNIVTTDHTSGLERRRLTVKIDRMFTAKEREEFQSRGGEDGIIHCELPGIVNWLLELDKKEVLHRIMHPPIHVLKNNLDAKKADNSVFAWITESTVYSPGHLTPIGDKRRIYQSGTETKYIDAEHDYDVEPKLYPNYLQWADRSGIKPHSLRMFTPMVIDALKPYQLEVDKKRTNAGRFISGLRIKKPDEDYSKNLQNWAEVFLKSQN